MIDFDNNLYPFYGHFIQLLNHPIPFIFVEVMPLQNKGGLALEKK
jgi:hypothetical protein